MLNHIYNYIFAASKTTIMKLKAMTIVILLCVGCMCVSYAQNNFEQTPVSNINHETDCKQVIVVWLNNGTIVKSAVYSDTANI